VFQGQDQSIQHPHLHKSFVRDRELPLSSSLRLAADMLMERLPSQIAVVLLDARAADLLAPAQSTLEEA
jgi:hypothetical protein